MDAEYPAFEPPLCSELKQLCRRLQEAYRELKEDLAPCRDDRYYRWARTPLRPAPGGPRAAARAFGVSASFPARKPEPFCSLREKGTAGLVPAWLLLSPLPRCSPSHPRGRCSGPAHPGFGETISHPDLEPLFWGPQALGPGGNLQSGRCRGWGNVVSRQSGTAVQMRREAIRTPGGAVRLGFAVLLLDSLSSGRARGLQLAWRQGTGPFLFALAGSDGEVWSLPVTA